MGFKVDTRREGEVTIVDLSGRLVLGDGAEKLRNSVKELLAKGHKKILVNLEDVNYVDSAGLGALVSSFTSASGRGGALKLVHVRDRVAEVMRVTRLAGLFESFKDEGDALRSFGA